jgi:hypothetical protein
MSKKRPAAPRQRAEADRAYARLAADICDLLRAIAPSEEALSHFRTARVEVLKGVRAVIDGRIERLSTRHQKGTPVTID